ncbi:MAG: TIGR00730 family Rossman fold protein [Ilumatobacteraceae bacterium]|nr:TIGR00730 family Rossman fold protein [Ilumatobacteraceae bacterium]
MTASSHTLKAIEELLKSFELRQRTTSDVRQLNRFITTVTELVIGPSSSLDIKIASAAIEEMSRAFTMFAPYRDVRKVSIFGSARTTPDSPIYALTAATAKALADHHFMVVTGAGPGIMEAGMVGAGRENSIGVSIRLPFESGANSVIAGDDKYVSMRYFFTRKLMLVKESHAFLCMPGGFGTLDETFELLTLAQTAKSVPVPIVFLEVPGQPFWTPLMKVLEPLLLDHGLISESDISLYTITDNINDAVKEITTFYANYNSIRFVDNTLYIRVQRAVPDDQFLEIATRFASLAVDGVILQTSATPEELKENDMPDLPRISLKYAAKGFADLRGLIDALNKF